MAKSWITTENKDVDVTWRFTVKNGVVKIIGTAGPLETAEILKRDEHGNPFLRLPLPDPDLAKHIEKNIREVCGEGVSGEGTFREEDGPENGVIEFEPEKQS
jgi:hypothetical protein